MAGANRDSREEGLAQMFTATAILDYLDGIDTTSPRARSTSETARDPRLVCAAGHFWFKALAQVFDVVNCGVNHRIRAIAFGEVTKEPDRKKGPADLHAPPGRRPLTGVALINRALKAGEHWVQTNVLAVNGMEALFVWLDTCSADQFWKGMIGLQLVEFDPESRAWSESTCLRVVSGSPSRRSQLQQ
ncbi:hypothetical protein HDU90_003804 [Geranomyces variabilis]|nr:hypothetical protein HDU90_003804 [Geranomyces variabilis]